MKALLTTVTALAVSSLVAFAAEDAAAGDKPAGKKRDPEATFKKLDANTDNAVSLEEFKNSGMAKKDPDKADQIFKRRDKDANGSLSLEEFKTHGKKKDAAGT